MNEETFKKAEVLYVKLITLKDDRKKLVKATALTDDITVKTESIFTNNVRVSTKYIDFNKFKSFLLEEIDKEIIKTQKEFNELWNRQ